jgi:hypothetical protein
MSNDETAAANSSRPNTRSQKASTERQLPIFFPAKKSVKTTINKVTDIDPNKHALTDDTRTLNESFDDNITDPQTDQLNQDNEAEDDDNNSNNDNNSNSDDNDNNSNNDDEDISDSDQQPILQPQVIIDDDDMAQHSSLLAPDVFRGTKNEEAEEWLQSVRHWLTFKEFTDAQSCTAIPVLLRDSALCWYTALPAATKTDIGQLTTAFLRRYKTDGITGWQDNAAIWTTKQLPSQSVDEYINLMEKKAAKTTAPDDQKRHAIIHGLRPAIRQQVLQHEIASIDQIRRWATIAESSEQHDDKHSEVSTTLKAIQEQIASLQIRSLTQLERTSNRQRSPSLRVQFQPQPDYRDSRPPPSPPQRTTYYGPPPPPPQWRRDDQNYDNSQPPHNYNNNPGGSGRRIFNPRFSNPTAQGTCLYCKGRPHPRSLCPARNDQCKTCSKFGHWNRCCLSAAQRP